MDLDIQLAFRKAPPVVPRMAVSEATASGVIRVNSDCPHFGKRVDYGPAAFGCSDGLSRRLFMKRTVSGVRFNIRRPRIS